MSSQKKLKQISIAEFMYQNIHLLGFENSSRALNVAFRELMDNSLDACNSANIAPEIDIKLERSEKNTYTLTFRDNGPGMQAEEAPNICCRLLYGDKFNDFKILRGQQGLGLTSLVLYAQKTSNEPATIIVKQKDDPVAIKYKLKIDLLKNAPIIVSKTKVNLENFESGFLVQLKFSATYVKKGAHSAIELLNNYLYLNPNLSLKFEDNDGVVIDHTRVTTEEVYKPRGVKRVISYQQLGDFAFYLRNSGNSNTTLKQSLLQNFEVNESEVDNSLNMLSINKYQNCYYVCDTQLSDLKKALEELTVNMEPHSDLCLPADPNLIRVVTKNNSVHFDQVMSASAKPKFFKHGVSRVIVYGFYGGETLSEENKIEVIRVANYSPLMYQSGSCLITKSIQSYNWKKVDFKQNEMQIPKGKLILIVHVNATKVPYNTESKDSIADDEVIKSQLTECLGVLTSKIKTYLNKLKSYKIRAEKHYIIKKILPDFNESLLKGKEIISNLNAIFTTNERKSFEEVFENGNPSAANLEVVTNIMESPCIYLHKNAEFMLAINPTEKAFNLKFYDRKDKSKLLEEINLEPKEYKEIGFRYDNKKYVCGGVSHVNYHFFEDENILKHKDNFLAR